MDIIQKLTEEFKLKYDQVEKTVGLIDEGNTIPFIARYRKEVTGSLDDTVLRDLNDRLAYLRSLDKRREEVRAAITEQGKMTDEISEAIDKAEILTELHCPFVINQNSYSILNRTPERNGILDAAEETGKGMIIFSPLSQGLLTNRYLNGIPEDSRIKTDGRFLKESQITPEMLSKLNRLNALAQERGQSLAQMALAWVYSRKAVTSVLIGASKPEQILDNVGMLKNTAFTEDELKLIDEISL